MLVSSNFGASANPVIFRVTVVTPTVVCAVKFKVGSILFLRPVPLKLMLLSGVKLRLLPASEKLPRSRPKSPLTSGSSTVPPRCSFPPISALSPRPSTRISCGASIATSRPITRGFSGAAGAALPRRRTSSTSTLGGRLLGIPIMVRFKCTDPATSSRSRAVPLTCKSALRFAVTNLLTSGWAFRALMRRSTGMPG